MTFSLIGRSKDGKEWGVAVASKFLAVGAYVPAAEAGAGALATPAYGNMALRRAGLEMLRSGKTASEVLDSCLADDPRREERQVGVVDVKGYAVTFTGNRCQSWAGGRAEKDPRGSYAAQGNMLAGPEVVDAMVETWLRLGTERMLAKRLVHSLMAGQSAGGDPRGQQAAAVLVVSKGKGYGGLSDVLVDLRSDNSPEPIQELLTMLDLHELYFGSTAEEFLLAVNEELTVELRQLLAKVNYSTGDVKRDLYNWMSCENFEERWYDTKIDPVVLKQLRLVAGQRSHNRVGPVTRIVTV